MDGGATFYVVMTALAAGGAVVQTAAEIQANERRQQVLEAEARQAELAALDEENRRLIALREANDEILARAGGVMAYASPSLLAAREFNFRMGMEDIKNIRLNLAGERSAISTKISILKSNKRASITKGIFDVAGISLMGLNKAGMLKKTTPVTKPSSGGTFGPGVGSARGA